MAKDKKNSSPKTDKKSKKRKKRQPSPEGLNGLLAQFQTVGDLRRQVSQLSTGQVVVGGVALLAAVLTYWAQQRASAAPTGATSSPLRAATPSPAVGQEQSPTAAGAAGVAPKKETKARQKQKS